MATKINLNTKSSIGDILIGNKDWTLAIPSYSQPENIKITIFDANDAEVIKYKKNHKMQLLAHANGDFNIYNNHIITDKALINLKGRYGIYYNYQHEILFVKWGEI